MKFFLFDIIVKGGPLMFPIVALSILGWAVGLERLWRTFRLPKRPQVREFAQTIFSLVDEGQFLRAETECVKFNHPVARVFKEGLRTHAYQKDDIKSAMERVANNEVIALERNFGLLITVVGVEPMLGFLGTIVGLIKAFMAWARMAENITVTALAGGIYQAMITTAAGLIVAIPLYLIYQMLVSRIRYITHDMSDLGDELILRLTYGATDTASRRKHP